MLFAFHDSIFVSRRRKVGEGKKRGGEQLPTTSATSCAEGRKQERPFPLSSAYPRVVQYPMNWVY